MLFDDAKVFLFIWSSWCNTPSPICLSFSFFLFYHAIKIQPIRIQEKPSYIWWYYTQSSQHLLCVCHMDCVDRCIFYSMVLDSCVYQENTSSDKCDIPWCILYHKNVLHLSSLWKYLALCSFRCIFLPKLQRKKKNS